MKPSYYIIIGLAFSLFSCQDNEYQPQAPNLEVIVEATDTTVAVYPALGDASLSTVFSATVNGIAATVECKASYDAPVHFVQWAVEPNSSSTVVIDCGEVIRSYTITPMPNDATASVRGTKLTVDLTGSQYVVVKINDLPDLFLLADPKTDYKGSYCGGQRMYNAREYVKSSTEVSTQQMQQALNDAATFGTVLYFPAGIYRTGTVTIPSNSTLLLDAGAIILGSTQESDYVREKEYGTNAAAVGCLFRIQDVENVRILGNGTIDGSAWSGLRRQPGSDTNLSTEIYLIYATDSKNIKMDGLTLRDPSFWNTRIFRCTDVEMSNIKVINCRPVSTYNTTDGVDFDSSQHCSLNHGFIYGGDDNCVVKGRDRKKEYDTFDILFKDIVCYSNTCGCKIGTESFNNQIYDVTFEDIDIVSSQRTMAIDVKDGSQIHDVTFRNIRVHGLHKLNGSYRMLDLSLNDRSGVTCLSTIKNVTFDNISYLCAPDAAKIRVNGLSAESYIDGVTFDGVIVNGNRALCLADFVASESNVETNEFVNNLIFR